MFYVVYAESPLPFLMGWIVGYIILGTINFFQKRYNPIQL